jgi:type IV secretory pathway VirB10-like protein
MATKRNATSTIVEEIPPSLPENVGVSEEEPQPAALPVETPPPPPPPPPVISVEDVLRLQDQVESYRATAIQTLLHQQQEIAEKLVRLGYGAVVPSSPTSQRPKPAVGGKAIRSDAFCKYCQIHGHDARLHRGQGEKKRKFTQAELDAIGNK